LDSKDGAFLAQMIVIVARIRTSHALFPAARFVAAGLRAIADSKYCRGGVIEAL
jgi:hypothetical protein